MTMIAWLELIGAVVLLILAAVIFAVGKP